MFSVIIVPKGLVSMLPLRDTGIPENCPDPNLVCHFRYLYGISNTVFTEALTVARFTFLPVLVVISTTPLPAREPYNAAALGPFRMVTLSMLSGLISEIALP